MFIFRYTFLRNVILLNKYYQMLNTFMILNARFCNSFLFFDTLGMVYYIVCSIFEILRY